MRIKNKDIAEKLGISTTAVSLAINNKPGISEETRMRVIKVISEYADQSVKSLNHTSEKPAQTKSILLSIHKKHGTIMDDKPFFSDLIETIQQEAMQYSYILNIAHFLPGQDIEEYIRYISSFPVEGMIVIGTEMTAEDYEYYLGLTIPVVLLDASFPLKNTDAVIIDNETSILRAFQYAVENGHRDIGFLKSNFWISNFQQRYDGFLKAIRQYHLNDYKHPVISLPCTVEAAYRDMKKYLENLPEKYQMPTIFLSDLDYIALGAMQALKEAGYRIPEDISIIGYDDLSICLASEPKLTSTKVNQAALGRQAVLRLMEKITNPTDYSTVTEISSELIVRESVQDLSGKQDS